MLWGHLRGMQLNRDLSLGLGLGLNRLLLFGLERLLGCIVGPLRAGADGVEAGAKIAGGGGLRRGPVRGRLQLAVRQESMGKKHEVCGMWAQGRKIGSKDRNSEKH